MVIVDYLQLIEEGAGRSDKNRAQSLGEISRGMKIMARELGCPMIVMSSLNRDSEKGERRPQLSDLRDSGAIEFDGDIVLLLHTPKVEDPPDIQDYEIIIAKQKNGPVGTIHLQFHRSFTRFRERGDIAA
jgi:replicative DNA helicase